MPPFNFLFKAALQNESFEILGFYGSIEYFVAHGRIL